MKYTTTTFLGGAALLLASCVSVPRDAGVNDVQQAIAQRGGGAVEWSAQPSPTDHERVAAMLQDELTADEAVAIAMVNNPRLQVTLAELGIARADLIEASTISNPVFEVEIRYPAEPYRPFELTLAQTLIDLIQLPRRRALGRAAFDAAQMRVSSEVLRFAAGVRSAYYDLLAASQQVALSRTAAESAQTAAEVAVKQHAAENITDLDLENEQALYEQTKLDLARAEQNVVLAREALLRAMGLRNLTAEWRLPASFPELPTAELEQQQLEQLAATQRLDIAIARRELEMAQQQVPIARLAMLEETVLDFHYEREPDGAHTIGPGLEIPIPIFNTGRAARTRAEAQFLAARHALAALESETASQLRAARSTLAEARARAEYYRDAIVPRRARIVELTKLEHNAMLAGVFQLLQAKQNEMQARRDFIEAQREYWSARTNLDRALQGVAGETSFTPATDQGQGKQADVTRGGH
ncbi:MAG TPA: TolC family protein [Thermoanaerobaculia bacterium]|jgi:cobalt-zinc-cadmium efflux system outer membrane protein